jgi:hypothetical protein
MTPRTNNTSTSKSHTKKDGQDIRVSYVLLDDAVYIFLYRRRKLSITRLCIVVLRKVISLLVGNKFSSFLVTENDY